MRHNQRLSQDELINEAAFQSELTARAIFETDNILAQSAKAINSFQQQNIALIEKERALIDYSTEGISEVFASIEEPSCEIDHLKIEFQEFFGRCGALLELNTKNIPLISFLNDFDKALADGMFRIFGRLTDSALQAQKSIIVYLKGLEEQKEGLGYIRRICRDLMSKSEAASEARAFLLNSVYSKFSWWSSESTNSQKQIPLDAWLKCRSNFCDGSKRRIRGIVAESKELWRKLEGIQRFFGGFKGEIDGQVGSIENTIQRIFSQNTSLLGYLQKDCGHLEEKINELERAKVENMNSQRAYETSSSRLGDKTLSDPIRGPLEIAISDTLQELRNMYRILEGQQLELREIRVKNNDKIREAMARIQRTYLAKKELEKFRDIVERFCCAFEGN